MRMVSFDYKGNIWEKFQEDLKGSPGDLGEY